jgi:membrane fusion protein, copper/silver efflux system
MNKWAHSILAVALATGFFLAGTWYNQRATVKGGIHEARRILYYQDPMHPDYKSDKPGIAPDCGMQLQPVYADSEAPELPGRHATSAPGSVGISEQQQRSIGLRTEEVTRASHHHTFRVLGRVALDETRIYRVAAAVDGWVRHAGPVTSGSAVHKDDVLATFYNRDFLTAQQTYLYALNTMDRFKNNESEDQLKLTKAQMRAASENLEFLGMGELQLQEIARTREIANEIELRSPVTGLVQARNAFPGLRFDRGSELFRIADLSHVWILADVFEDDARLLRAVRKATVRYQDRVLPVHLSSTLPQFDPVSRALKVRLETDNPDLSLRPDMFVDVEFQASLPAAIAVPVDAVIDSGLRKTVYVETSDGSFVPRQVETGWRLGDNIEIVNGLAPGERIVVAGNFLLDSESRMRLVKPR